MLHALLVRYRVPVLRYCSRSGLSIFGDPDGMVDGPSLDGHMRSVLLVLLCCGLLPVETTDATCSSVPYTSDKRYVASAGVGLTVQILCRDHGNAGLNPLALDTTCSNGWVCNTATGCTLVPNGERARCLKADAATCCYNPAFTARDSANPATQGATPGDGVTAYSTGGFTAAHDPGYGAAYSFPITALDTSKVIGSFQTGLPTQNVVAECGAAFPGNAESCYDDTTLDACTSFVSSMHGQASECTSLTSDTSGTCAYIPLRLNSLYHLPGFQSDYGLNAPPLQGKSATLWKQFQMVVDDGNSCPVRSG